MNGISNPNPSRTMGRRSLFRFVTAVLSIASSHAGVFLEIDVGIPDPLSPGRAGQVRDFFVANTGDTSFFAQGLTLRLQVDDGVGGGNAPVITGVEAVAGTSWEGEVGGGVNQTMNPEFWDVRLLSNFFAGNFAEFPAHSLTKLASVTFDSTGVGSGTWVLKFSEFDLVPDPGDTKYNQRGSGSEFFPAVQNGSISVVPEPQSVALVAVISMLGFSVGRRVARRFSCNRSLPADV